MEYIPGEEIEEFFYDEMPPRRHLDKVLKAGLSNPFVSQFFSVLVSRNALENIYKAPVELIICADLYKITKILEKKEETNLVDDKTLLSIAMRDALFATHSMALQADNHGIKAMYVPIGVDRVKEIRQVWDTPDKVVPFLSLALGYPIKRVPRHVNFAKDFIFFEKEYPAAKHFLIDEIESYLDNGNGLIDYYKKIDVSSSDWAEKDNWDWADLLCSNCNYWTKIVKDFNKILKECGLDPMISS